MPSNAFDTMVVPVIRGLFLTAILGGAAVGLARMLKAIGASIRSAGDEAPRLDAEGPPSAPEAVPIPAAEGLATAGTS